jgi:hypothetical protein
MKKILTLLFIFTAVNLYADDYGYLTFQTSDGQQQSISVSNLKLKVSGGSLVVTNGSASTTFTLTNLSKMYFSNTTGISTVGAQDKDVAVIAFTTAGVNMGNMLLLMRLNQNCNLEYTL